jgi:hypothetical protein
VRRVVLGPCPAAHIEVRQISDHEWRVGDGRADEMSAEKVLGFIQSVENRFEVLNIKAPQRDLVFDRWDAALSSFVSG